MIRLLLFLTKSLYTKFVYDLVQFIVQFIATSKLQVHKGYILSPILFNIYGVYMRRMLDDWEGRVKLESNSISDLRYADDTTLIANFRIGNDGSTSPSAT